MESGKRSSFDEIGMAAIRRFTRTPTSHRLSLRRSSTASTSSSSIRSFESEKQPPCVYEITRETMSDECALHRFIVWAAVKRNDCPKMTAEERRECPLLRCRKRFPNHELLLQHLYDCKYLESGEYWCYDCGKVETFHEINKCRRCLGHPSKRKKLITLAKSVFSSLGRPKTPTPSPSNLEIEDNPPSYECLVHDGSPAEAHPGFELQSNEIHEIDSSEVALAPIPEDREAFQEDHLSRSSSTSSAYTACAQPLSIYSRKSMSGSKSLVNYEAYINWSSSPSQTVSPADLVKPGTANTSAKPTLQLNTRAAFDMSRARSRRRSRNLQPSSSVRSTSSTTSTNSTSSTTSMASYTISPMSAWSGAWENTIGFESTLTSPADDVPNPDDVFPCSQPLPLHPDVGDVNMAFSHFVDGPTGLIGLTELPADIPMVLDNLDLLDANQSSVSSTTPLVPSPAAALQLESLQNDNQQSQQLIEDLKRQVRKQASPHALIHSARDTLDLHVSGSLDKLQLLSHDGKNHVASRFCSMPANSVALTGLETMSDILQGQQVQSPEKILCFLHIVYSLSLVIHEQHATNWLTELFNQAVSYCSWMTQEDTLAYLQVVDFLWKPGNVTDEDFMGILQRCLPEPSFPSNAGKGKEPATYIDLNNDPLLFISQYFLDELEYAALQNTTKPEIQTSNLCTQHLKDSNLSTMQDSPFVDAAKNLILSLSQQYHHEGGFVLGMKELLDRLESNHVSTVRRLELELLQSGKMQLPPDLYFDVYVKQVRVHIDSIQIQNGLQYPLRLQYHRLGIELMASVMHGSDVSVLGIDMGQPRPEISNHGTSELQMPINFAFDDLIPIQPGLPIDDKSLGSICTTAQTPVGQQQWLSASTPSTHISAPSQPRTPSTPPTSGEETLSSKGNSEMCCEICGYRPKGNPQWFHGSMAKHKKLMHANTPPKIYPCPFPGCNSQYKNRPDNLRQHQIEKGHFVDGQEGSAKSRKRRKME